MNSKIQLTESEIHILGQIICLLICVLGFVLIVHITTIEVLRELSITFIGVPMLIFALQLVGIIRRIKEEKRKALSVEPS